MDRGGVRWRYCLEGSVQCWHMVRKRKQCFFSGVGSHALVMSGNKDQVVEWRLGNRVSQSGNEG